MPLSIAERRDLFLRLEQQGWQWRGSQLFAPHRTLWLSAFRPWAGDLTSFRDRMLWRLRRVGARRALRASPERDDRALEDTISLVEALTVLLCSAVEARSCAVECGPLMPPETGPLRPLETGPVPIR